MSNRSEINDLDQWGSKPVTPEVLQEIQSAWENETGKDEFETEMGVIFAGIAEDLNKATSDNTYWVLTENDTYRAILEVIDTRRGQMTKLLTLHLSPTYWDEPSEPMLSRVYTEAVATVLFLGGERAVNGRSSTHDVKIFGRNRALLDILRRIDNNWGSISQSGATTAQMEGRWLRITLHGES